MSIFLGARDLAGVPIGTHQFILLKYSNATNPVEIGFDKTRSVRLASNIYGIVIAAHNKAGKLVVLVNEANDIRAAKEYFGEIKTKWYQSDFDPELRKVNYAKLNDSLSKARVIKLASSYIINQKLDPIRYPTAGLGANCNAWAQSVIEYSGGHVDGNMNGLDLNNSKRIPRTYFTPVCTLNPRPKVN